MSAPKFKLAAECQPCEGCGEPWCDDCKMHYADCRCPGPNSEGDEALDDEGKSPCALKVEP